VNGPREARWFLVNYVLLNAYVFVLSAIQGVVLLTSSSDGSIPGWPGSPIEQVFWYSVSGVFMVAVFYWIPVLLVVLLAWRLAIRLVGHPRLTAYLVTTLLVVAAALRIERTEPFYLAIVLMAALGFATIVRAPTHTSSPDRPSLTDPKVI
jgi:predicted neutral ceramidase superfamily lipid hydrolase